MNSYKTLWAIFVINVMFVFMMFTIWGVHDGNYADICMTVMVGVFGVLSGWLAGALSSPSSQKEEVRFTKYAGLISGFLSGYLVSKIDFFVTDLAQRIGKEQIYGFRVMIFVSCFIAGLLLMYFFRAYITEKEAASASKNETRG